MKPRRKLTLMLGAAVLSWGCAAPIPLMSVKDGPKATVVFRNASDADFTVLGFQRSEQCGGVMPGPLVPPSKDASLDVPSSVPQAFVLSTVDAKRMKWCTPAFTLRGTQGNKYVVELRTDGKKCYVKATSDDPAEPRERFFEEMEWSPPVSGSGNGNWCRKPGAKANNSSKPTPLRGAA